MLPDNTRDHVVEALAELRDRSGIGNMSRGSTAGVMVNVLGSVNRRYMNDMISYLLGSLVNSATGNDLDILGTICGLRRYRTRDAEASAAERVCRFYSKRGTFGDIHSSTFTIPAGTRIDLREYADDASVNTVRVTEDVVCNTSESEAWFSCRSELRGADGTVGRGAMYSHSFTAYDDVDHNTLGVENVSPIIGENEESDEHFRARIIRRRIQQGGVNTLSVELAALSVPGVADARVIPFEAGAGTSTCLITTTVGRAGSALQARVSSVVGALNLPLSQTITVDEPDYLGIELYTRARFKDGASASDKASAISAAKRAVAHTVGNLWIGDSISINSIASVIMEAMAPHISDIGLPGIPIEQHWVWKETQDGRRYRNISRGNYVPDTNDRVILEDIISNPVRIESW